MRPDPERARAWLESELSKPEYHQQGLLERFLGWLYELWARITASASDAGSLSLTAAVALALLVVVAALLVVPRIRRTPRAATGDRPVLGDEQTSAEEHRRRAGLALADSRYSDAVVEAMRALALRMVDRGLLEATPGSTAHEIALSVADTFPGHRDRLVAAADVFDAVQYGGAGSSAEQASALIALHDDLRRAAPSAGAGSASRTPAVPR